jgi:hypothetical protein
MSNDEYVRDLQEKLSIVSDDFYWVDGEGRKRMDTESTGELTSFIGDTLRTQFREFQLPVLEGETTAHSYKFTNLNLHTDVPLTMKFHIETDAAFRKTEGLRLTTEMTLTASILGIKLNATGINFEYRSPMIYEDGIMDLSAPNINLWIDFIYGLEKEDPNKMDSKSRLRFLRVNSHVRVLDLDITYHRNTISHTILVPVLTRIFQGFLISKLESTIQYLVNENFMEAGQNMVRMLENTSYPLIPVSSLSTPSPPVEEKEESKKFRQRIESPKVERQVPKTSVH